MYFGNAVLSSFACLAADFSYYVMVAHSFNAVCFAIGISLRPTSMHGKQKIQTALPMGLQRFEVSGFGILFYFVPMIIAAIHGYIYALWQGLYKS
jgi:hypothetical protein